ncbi:hypothetical protein AAFF_G00167590 [Aldrovandia affinis]|uniref:Uncharacterized protein n=1 Tax=Aldrovandia affinis TaxID=143900 RepID=A0AAD7RM72_9TELE|nr:hypothetical protein AAFF_G00167590 [Aldrovandia affinis]
MRAALGTANSVASREEPPRFTGEHKATRRDKAVHLPRLRAVGALNHTEPTARNKSERRGGYSPRSPGPAPLSSRAKPIGPHRSPTPGCALAPVSMVTGPAAQRASRAYLQPLRSEPAGRPL